jgi:hypothetical protein
MAKSLSELWATAREEEFQAKIAAVEEQWGESDELMSMLDQTVDLLKEAEDSGHIVQLDPCDMFTLAVNIVDDLMKEAADDAACDAEDDDDDKKPAFMKGKDKKKEMDKEAEDDYAEELAKVAAEEAYFENIGAAASAILAEHGIELSDLEKIAEEDVEELGRWIVHQLIAQDEAE